MSPAAEDIRRNDLELLVKYPNTKFHKNLFSDQVAR
jgi:hypothetical protein